MIIYAWVNDDDTRRAFRKMLESGYPADGWNQLLSRAELEGHRPLRVFSTLSQ